LIAEEEDQKQPPGISSRATPKRRGSQGIEKKANHGESDIGSGKPYDEAASGIVASSGGRSASDLLEEGLVRSAVAIFVSAYSRAAPEWQRTTAVGNVASSN
jgi:hypothetical protein